MISSMEKAAAITPAIEWGPDHDREPSPAYGSGAGLAAADESGPAGTCPADAPAGLPAGAAPARAAKPVIKAGVAAYRKTRLRLALIATALAEARAELDRDTARTPPAAAVGGPGMDEDADVAGADTVAAAPAGRGGSSVVASPRRGEHEAEVQGLQADGGQMVPLQPERGGAFALHQPVDAMAWSAPGPAPVWWLLALLLVPVLIGGLSTYLGSAQLEKVYAARSEVVFDVRQLGGDTAERFLGTQVLIARSRSLVGPIAERFDLPIRELDQDLSVEMISNSGVLRLQYENRDPALALEVTKALTDRYLVSLRELEQHGGGDHRLLTPTFVLDEPVSPQPLRTAAFGALAGLAIGACLIVVKLRARILK